MTITPKKLKEIRAVGEFLLLFKTYRIYFLFLLSPICSPLPNSYTMPQDQFEPITYRVLGGGWLARAEFVSFYDHSFPLSSIFK